MSQRVHRTKSVQLTEKTVSSLAPGAKRSDGIDLPGGGRLIVRAKSSSRNGTVREFFFRYWSDDASERALLVGRHGDGSDGRSLTLKQARAEAQRYSKVLKAGKDPQFQREMERQANREAERMAREAIEHEARKGTLSDLIASYVVHLKAQSKASALDTEKTLERHVLKPFPELAARRARDITAEDVTDVLARMIAKGIERRTNIVRSMLRAAFAYGAGLDNDPVRKAKAIKEGDLKSPKLFGITGNPVADIKRVRDYDRAGERILTDAELRSYVEAINPFHPGIAGALKFALFLGGQRMSQLLRATWKDYEAEERLLRLQDSKGRGGIRPHVLPISERLAAILEGLRGVNHEGPYIFSTRSGKTPIDVSTLSNAVSCIAAEICNKGAQEPFGAGDLRRTAETRLARLGISKDHRAQLLSHGRQSDVQTKHYDKHEYIEEKAAALAKWEAHLDSVISGKTEKVIRGRFRTSA
jgi:integrase